MNTRFGWTTVLLLGLLSARGTASAQAGPTTVNDPCADSQYLALKARPVNGLSEREYQLLRDQQRACLDIQKLKAKSAPAPLSAADFDPRKLEAFSKTSAFPNTDDIYVRNNSGVPIVVVEIRLVECVNMVTVCGTSYPRITVGPGQTQRVLTVHRSPDEGSSFSFQFKAEPKIVP